MADKDQEALEFLEDAVQQFPGEAEIRLMYASALLMFRPEDVLSQLKKAVELSPNDPVILVRAGNQMLNEGDIEAARSCAARASALASPHFILKSGLVSLDGRIAAFDGDDELAEEKLRRAAAEDPEYSSFAINLARFLNERDRRVEAIAVVDHALATCRMKDGLKELREEIVGTSPGDDEGRE